MFGLRRQSDYLSVGTTQNFIDANTVFYFKFENNLTDETGLTSYAALVNSPTYSANSRSGVYSLNYGNTPNAGKFVNITNSGVNVGTGNFTIEAWIMSVGRSDWGGSNSNYYHRLFSWGALSVGFQDTAATNGNWEAHYYDGTNGYGGSAYPVVTANNWNHVVFIRDGANLRYGLNGVLNTIGSGIAATNFTYTSGNYGRIGGPQNSISNSQFLGYIDSMRFSNTIRYTGSSYTVPTSL